jgi:hypothetical protein
MFLRNVGEFLPGYTELRVGVRVPVGASVSSCPQRPDRSCSPHSLLSNGYRGPLFPGREANHSSPASGEVKNTWIYTSTSPYVFVV